MRSSRVSLRTAVILSVVVAVPVFVGPPSVAAVDTAPTARWAFDEGTGRTAHDSVGTADGDLQTNADWETLNAADGPAALDSRGGSVLVVDDPMLDPADPTVSVWIRSYGAAVPEVGDVIVEKGAFACDGPSYGLYVSADGLELRFRSEAQPGGIPITIDVPSILFGVDSLWDGQWHLAGFAIPTANHGPYVSIDGFERSFVKSWSSGQTTAVTYAGASDDSLRIGGPVAGGCGGGLFSGAIDDVRFWSSWEAVTELGTLMPPVPTTTTLLSDGPFTVGAFFTLTATVEPEPLLGTVTFEWVDPDTAEVVLSGSGTRADGEWTGQGFPPAVGTYVLRAVYGGHPPLEPSSDSATVQVEAIPSTTTVTTVPDPVVPDVSVGVIADVTSGTVLGDVVPTGSIEFVESPGPSETVLGTVALEPIETGHARAILTLPNGLTVGDHPIEARYEGDAVRSPSTGSLALSVGKAAAFVVAVGPGEVQTHHTVRLDASIGTSGNDPWSGASVTFRRTGGGAIACVVPADPNNLTHCDLTSLPIGTIQFEAVYSGNATTAPATSDPFTIVVTADALEATGVTTNYTVFYPYKDGYRDGVTLSGSRQEPISVGIRIYSPTGSLVRSTTLARASGTYAYTWNGRNSAGTMLAAGKYKVVQTLTDAFGTKAAFTRYVTLSTKQLVTRTAYVTKAGSAITASGDPGTGSISISSTGGYVRLTGRDPGGWVGVGYQFTLPTATIYKSVAFQVYGKGARSVPPKLIGLQNFRTCPLTSGAWDESCFDHWAVIGSTSATTLLWQSATGSVSTNITGRTVRGMVSVAYSTQTIYKARVKIVYGILQ